MKVFCVIAFLGSALAGRTLKPAFLSSHLPAAQHLESYSIDQFAREFGRSYKIDSVDYQRRLSLFQASVARINAVNARNLKEGRAWVAGVHPFMDWSASERKGLNGYKPSRARGQGPAARMTALQTHASVTSHSAAMTRSNSTLVDSFDWGEGAPIRQQGNCGSCWAISAVEAVEAQLIKNGDHVRLSAQALVDCVPNPQHCGGTGGCDGATGELAYTFMRDHGIPLEADLPYSAVTGTCEISGVPKQPVLDEMWPSDKRVVVSGWNQLPSNKAEPLKQALTQQGPVVVAVDGNNWFDYQSGVFDGCEKDAELGHAVLLKGYGEDDGKKYWRIQNSWGGNWGEQGHIRMTRHDNEDEWCGTDHKPQDGLGCDGGPPEITVCGMCGILYDPIVPEGVRLEDAANDKASAATTPVDYPVWKPSAADAKAAQPSAADAKAEPSSADDAGETQKMQSLFSKA